MSPLIRLGIAVAELAAVELRQRLKRARKRRAAARAAQEAWAGSETSAVFVRCGRCGAPVRADEASRAAHRCPR